MNPTDPGAPPEPQRSGAEPSPAPGGHLPGRGPRADLAPGPRLLACSATWLLLVLAQPGWLGPDGFGHLGFLALAPWGWAASRPGRWARTVEWSTAVLGLVGWTLWMRFLLPGLVPFLGLIPALWVMVAGVLLRRLSRRYVLALAVPAAWLGGELLRWLLPAPFSFGWWRLGLLTHDSPWIAGSARVWGTWGLSWVLAAMAGLAADLWVGRGSAPARAWVLGLGPLLLGIALAALVPAPETVPGPRLLLVTPGLEQERKVWSEDPFRTMYVDPLELTLEGLAAEERPVDLVCWGESMLPGHLLEPGVLEAARAGVRSPDWVGRPMQPGDLESGALYTHSLVAGVMQGRPVALSLIRQLAARDASFVEDLRAQRAVLPPDTSFLSGVISFTVHDGELRRRNSVALWTPREGEAQVASKTHLVPAAEDPAWLVLFPWIRDLLLEVGGYVPDLVPGDRVGVLTFPTRSGREMRAAATVCYDNVFDAPYYEALQAGPVDLFLVCSNEAWYRRTAAMDHMLAFSRLLAIASGRAIARPTNSGATSVLAPDGSTVDELWVDGRRKMVRGTLAVTVPVPAAGEAARTPWSRTARFQPWLLAALVGFLGLRAGRDGNRGGETG